MEQRFTFSKQEKLTGETVVTELFQKGASYISYPVRVVWFATIEDKNPGIKVLMSVPKKKLKHAVDRNRVKRLLREAYRLHKHELTEMVSIHGLKVEMAFVWIPSEVLDFEKVERKVIDALVKMQKLLMPSTETEGNTISSSDHV